MSREIPREIQVMIEAEAVAVASLFSIVNSSRSATSVPQLTQTIGNMTVTAALLHPAGVAAAGDASVTLASVSEGANENASSDRQVDVAVSSSTLQQIFSSSSQGVILTIAADASNSLGDFLGEVETAVAKSKGKTLDGGKVKRPSINLKDLDGTPVHLTFEEPLNISMGANASGSYECFFWNRSL